MGDAQGHSLWPDEGPLSTVIVQVAVLSDLLEKLRRLAAENGWSEEEALRIALANGVHYLLGEKRLASAPADEASLRAEVARLTEELMDMHSMYAVMKFRAFTLEQEKQVLEFRVTGLEGENRMSAWRLAKFRKDEEALRAELRRLQEENERLSQEVTALRGPSPPPPPPGWRRLLARLRARGKE